MTLMGGVMGASIRSVTVGAPTPTPSSQWSPNDLGASLLAWWDVRTGRTVDGSSGVSELTDRKTGGTNHLTQATAGKRPVYSATSFNGALPGMTFDGTDDELLFTTGITADTATTGQAVHAALQNNGAASNRSIVSKSAAHNSAPQFRFNSTQNLELVKSYATVIRASAGTLTTGYHVVGHDISTAENNFYLDGTMETYADAKGTFPTAIDSVGANGGADWFAGVIGELVVTLALSDVNNNRMTGYLAHQWNLQGNLPAGHPYKATAPTSGFTPASLGSKLLAWYDAQDTASITHASGVVSQWNDKSGNARHASQATEANKPTYSATGYNGVKPGITFDGTADFLDMASGVSYSGATGIAIWAAANATGTADRAIVGGGNGSIELRFRSGNLDILKTTIANLQSATIANGYHIVGGELATSSTALSIDGTRTTGTTDPAITDPINQIGKMYSGDYFDSVIGEIVISGGLTAAERYDLNAYMTERW